MILKKDLKILITAGPTREPIDPVRYLTNRSSGKMGYAIAESAINRNHEVILVSGPVSLEPPQNCRIINIETAAQMYEEVSSNSNNCDAVIMVAAVADYTPDVYHDEKIKMRNDYCTVCRKQKFMKHGFDILFLIIFIIGYLLF